MFYPLISYQRSFSLRLCCNANTLSEDLIRGTSYFHNEYNLVFAPAGTFHCSDNYLPCGSPWRCDDAQVGEIKIFESVFSHTDSTRCGDRKRDFRKKYSHLPDGSCDTGLPGLIIAFRAGYVGVMGSSFVTPGEWGRRVAKSYEFT